MPCKKSYKKDKPYKYEADFKYVLQDFALNYLLEQPDDLAEFGISYFRVLKERGIVVTVEYPSEFVLNDETEVYPTSPLIRRKTIFSDPFNPEIEEMEEREHHPKTPAERENLYHRAKQVMLFSAVEEDQFEILLDAMFAKYVSAGEKVIQQGDDGDFFYIIDYGVYETTMRDKDDITTSIKTYNNKGSFGELALMYNVPRSATVTAKTDGRLWVMKRDTFRRIVLTNAFKKRKLYEELIEKVPMLSVLEPYERLNVADALESRTYKDGERIINQGDAADGMFFIESGDVDIAIQNDAGREIVITKLTQGDYFGEIALVTHQPRAASARARGSVKLAYLDVEAFERLLGPCMTVMKRNVALYEQQLKYILGEIGASPQSLRNY